MQIDELGLYIQAFLALHDTPCEHRPHAELATRGARIDVVTAISKRRAPRHHLELRKLGKAVDEALGNPVGEVVHFTIVPGVLEGQHCQGADRPVRRRGTKRQNGDRDRNQNCRRRDRGRPNTLALSGRRDFWVAVGHRARVPLQPP